MVLLSMFLTEMLHLQVLMVEFQGYLQLELHQECLNLANPVLILFQRSADSK